MVTCHWTGSGSGPGPGPGSGSGFLGSLDFWNSGLDLHSAPHCSNLLTTTLRLMSPTPSGRWRNRSRLLSISWRARQCLNLLLCYPFLHKSSIYIDDQLKPPSSLPLPPIWTSLLRQTPIAPADPRSHIWPTQILSTYIMRQITIHLA